MTVPLLRDLAVQGLRVLIRADLNVPMHAGNVRNAARIDAALPTIRHCLDANAAVLLASHLGRPTPGQADAAFSLAPVAEVLASRLGRPVALLRDWQQAAAVRPGRVALLENIRFEPGETANDPALAKRLAALCDVFVMDAFGTAHRAHASTCGVIDLAPAACAGLLLEAELNALGQVLENPVRPLLAIVGGAKVSSKLALLETLATRADAIIVGGGIANTFLLATGASVGQSLVERDLVPTAQRIMAKVDVPIPVDVMTAPSADAGAAPEARLRPANEVGVSEAILDLGPETLRRMRSTIENAGTILWNGPLGVFEFDQFGEGTRALAEAVAASRAFSVAGGGDTVAAIDRYGVDGDISYLSTGGGAFLAFVEGRTLPAIAALQERGRCQR